MCVCEALGDSVCDAVCVELCDCEVWRCVSVYLCVALDVCGAVCEGGVGMLSHKVQRVIYTMTSYDLGTCF